MFASTNNKVTVEIPIMTRNSIIIVRKVGFLRIVIAIFSPINKFHSTHSTYYFALVV